jgi:hypothetical protein
MTAKDYSEWRRNGHGPSELEDTVESTPFFAAYDDTADPQAADIPVPDPHETVGNGNASTGDVSTHNLLRAWRMPEPAPRRFIVKDLIPAGVVTSLYGDGGLGKSYVALFMAMSCCMARPFAGLPVEQCRALYLDGELDADEFLRRSYKLARGVGLDRPPRGLYYYRLDGPLGDTATQEEVRQLVSSHNIRFIVLDSLTMAAYTADTTEAPAVIATIKFLETLGTVLAIDHIPKSQAGVNQSHYTQFGSVFKRNAVRSQIQVVKAAGGALSLLHKKANFGPQLGAIYLAMEFGASMVKLVPLAPGDPRAAGIDENLPAMEQVYLALVEAGDCGAIVEGMAADSEMSAKTIRNHLTVLKQAGRAENMGGSRWRARVIPVPDPDN